MKKILSSVGLILSLSLGSCIIDDQSSVGPVGPQGPQGPQGAAGESGYVFEWENINFTAGGDYEILLEYPGDFEVFDSDVAIVYLLWPTEDNADEDIWRQLPQTVLHPEGLLQYNFDFTKFDVRLFLDANFDLDLLGAIDTDDWVARVVVVPGEFWDNGRVDFSDYNKIKETLGLPELNKPTGGSIRR